MIIRKFISQEKVTLLTLFIMLLNPFSYGYRIAVLFFLLIFFQSKKYIHLVDKNVVYLIIFATSYEIIAAMRIDVINKTLFSILPNMFIPALIYLVGKRIASKYPYSDIRIFFLFFLSLSFSLIPILSILNQIIKNGFSIGSRDMHLFWDKGETISATGLASYFSINMGAIALINIKKKSSTQKRINLGVLILFALSLFCAIRLGSRTQLGVALFSFILSFLYNYSSQSLSRKIFHISLFVFVIFSFYYLLNSGSEFIFFFEDRLDSNTVGIGTAGGRSARWIESIKAIFTDPGGWDLARYGYAHNLWLDVARVSGVIALLPLLFFSISSIKLLIKSLVKLKNDPFLRTYILCIFLSIFLVFNVEPVMEGIYLLFLFFCLFVGFLSGILKSRVGFPLKISGKKVNENNIE